MATVRKHTGLPTCYGDGEIYSFYDLEDGREHIALIFEDAHLLENPVVRIHSECLTGDVFGSLKCDCGPQLHAALDFCREWGGIILYLRQEGRGIGLYNKIDAYDLQEQGLDTFQANRKLKFPKDGRNFKVAADMLKALGISSVRLLSNNPDKVKQLQKHGIQVEKRISTGLFKNPHNEKYIKTKIQKAKHSF